MGPASLSLVDDREQFQVARPQRNDPVGGSATGMRAALERLKPVCIADLACRLIEVTDAQDDVVDGELGHQCPCTRVGVTRMGTE